MADTPSSETTGDPSVDSFWYVRVPLAMGSPSPKVNLTRSEQSGGNTSESTGNVLPDTAQRALNTLYSNGIWLAHNQFTE